MEEVQYAMLAAFHYGPKFIDAVFDEVRNRPLQLVAFEFKAGQQPASPRTALFWARR